MTLKHTLPARRKWECDVCKKIDFWDKNWSHFGSIAMEEACPNDIPTVCSDGCRKIFTEKINRGEVVLPKLKNHPGGFIAITGRVGY